MRFFIWILSATLCVARVLVDTHLERVEPRSLGHSNGRQMNRQGADSRFGSGKRDGGDDYDGNSNHNDEDSNENDNNDDGSNDKDDNNGDGGGDSNNEDEDDVEDWDGQGETLSPPYTRLFQDPLPIPALAQPLLYGDTLLSYMYFTDLISDHMQRTARLLTMYVPR